MPPDKKMDKKKSLLIIISFLVLSFMDTAPLHAQSLWAAADTAAHNLVWEEKLYRRVSFLSDSLCAGRATGTVGNNEAAFWITGRFADTGLMPFGNSYAKHVFAGQGLVGHNIIGLFHGSRKRPSDSYIIVGTHYDHLGTLDGKMYPGADSNASGVAALLSIVDMFTTMKMIGKVYKANIIFAAFDAKEMNMAGSQAFWRMIENGELSDPLTGKTIAPENISAMINIDQIGASLAPLRSGRQDYLIALGMDTLPEEKQKLLSQCNRFYGTHLELSETYYGSEKFTRLFYGLSDQKVFAEHGIPAVFLTSGITMNTFKTYDLPETLDYPVLRKRIILMFQWISKLTD